MRSSASALVLLSAALAVVSPQHSALLAQSTLPARLDRPPVDREVPPHVREPFCGLPRRDTAEGVSRPRIAPPDGAPLWFRQEPSLLGATYTGALRLAEFTVAGDVPVVRFSRFDSREQTETIESWPRTATATIDGHLVSVFEPSWEPAVVADLVGRTRRGPDQPTTYFGRYLGPEDGSDDSVSIYLRYGFGGIPPARVVVIDDSAQYASHVVNLVLPAFDLGRLNDEYGFDLEAATKRFFELFEDRYEVVSVIPQYTHPTAEYVAFHQNTQNAVRGTGAAVFNRAARYGSSGTLMGVEVFADGGYADNRLANHELTHAWGHYFDWRTIAGIDTLDTVHSPLMTGGESLVGRALRAWNRVGGTPESPVVEQTPVYARQHPLELYAMGFLDAASIPALRVFTNQQQFVETGVVLGPLPDPAGRDVTIDDIMRRHGPREGPVITSIRRATLVITRDRLLTADEMTYWNYVAARLADPNRTGLLDYDGQASFEFATDQRIDVDTAIVPKGAEPVAAAPYELDFPPFDVRECPGVTFEAPVPSRILVGQRMRVNGRVTATDRSDFNQILLRYWRRGGNSNTSVRTWAELSRSGVFNLEYEFRDGQEGVYLLEAFLFWPGSGTQWPRCSLSTTIVTSPVQAP